MDDVILVDQSDREIGAMPKMEAHIQGQLHRAFSVFIFNTDGALLLQQRAFSKYHSGGKWTNTCCSHPRPGERTADAADRRLQEEMDMACKLDAVFSFCYKAEVENGLIEHEFDHVYFGTSDILPVPDPEEVADFRYISMDDLKSSIAEEPEMYTEWFKICFDQVMDHYEALFVKSDFPG